MLTVFAGWEVPAMTQIAAVRARLEQANGLPGILDAAYDAFEAMLAVIHGQEDGAGDGFAAFVMSAVSAANGRDAVAAAPSLPSAACGGAPPGGGLRPGLTPQEAAAVLAGLSGLLASRLADAAAWAADGADQAACVLAARHATAIWSRLAGAAGR